MGSELANVWYVKRSNTNNPLQPNAKRTKTPRMYIKEMPASARKRFPVKGFTTLYSIHDEKGLELGVTDSYETAFQLAKSFGMDLNSVH